MCLMQEAVKRTRAYHLMAFGRPAFQGFQSIAKVNRYQLEIQLVGLCKQATNFLSQKIQSRQSLIQTMVRQQASPALTRLYAAPLIF